MHGEGCTNRDVAYLSVESFPITIREVSQRRREGWLTNTVLPFVYTIFSLFALSLVYSPRMVVGLAGYRATLVNDIVFDKEIAIDINISYKTNRVRYST